MRSVLHQERRRLLFAEYFAAELGIQLSAARKRLSRGDFGPAIRIGRRLALRVEAYEEHLRRLEQQGVALRGSRGGAA
jgi:hypothetical protein